MEWEHIAESIYNEITQNIPLPMRQVAAPSIRTAAERRCESSGRNQVCREDLIEAIFEVVPQSFKANAVANLTSMGIDCRPYLSASPSPVVQTDLQQLMHTLRTLGDHLGVQVDDKKIRTVLSAFRPFFKQSPLSVKVERFSNTHRELSVRYLETAMAHTPDPMTRGTLSGCVADGISPLKQAYDEAKRILDVLGYGVELNSHRGLSQIWMALVPISLNQLLSLKQLPPSLHKHAPLLAKFGLQRFSLIGFDLMRSAVRLFVMLKEVPVDAVQKYERLIHELSFQPMSTEVLTHFSSATILSCSFSWQSNEMTDMGFHRLYTRKAQVPVHLDSLLNLCVEDSLFNNGHERFVVAATLQKSGIAFQIENDHNGCMFEAIEKASRLGA